MEGKEEDTSDASKEAAAAFPARESSQGTNATFDSGKDDTNEGAAAADAECRSQEATFPQQLMDVIENETSSGTTTSEGEKVLEWLSNGDAFIIRDKSLLEKEVLPKYFNAKCKFMSFVRKLYRYVLPLFAF
jgi:hypothetical protein